MRLLGACAGVRPRRAAAVARGSVSRPSLVWPGFSTARASERHGPCTWLSGAARRPLPPTARVRR